MPSINFIALSFTFWQNCVGYKLNFTKVREFSILFLKVDNLCQKGAKGENVFLLMKERLKKRTKLEYRIFQISNYFIDQV